MPCFHKALPDATGKALPAGMELWGGNGLPSLDELMSARESLANTMAQGGVVDVAFAYAMKQVDFNPLLVLPHSAQFCTHMKKTASGRQENLPVNVVASSFKQSGMKLSTNTLR